MGKAVGRPPLAVFRFFDVAGRHQSFAKAARELGVTPGAVAHRVRTLEQYLGEELFERQLHGLALSARGQAFFVEVQHILSALDTTTERFRASAKGGVQAALEGMGVALGHSLLVAPYLERGTLVALFEPPVAAPARYFPAVAPGSEEKPEARAFRDWLRAETQKSDAAGEPASKPAPRGKG